MRQSKCVSLIVFFCTGYASSEKEDIPLHLWATRATASSSGGPVIAPNEFMKALVGWVHIQLLALFVSPLAFVGMSVEANSSVDGFSSSDWGSFSVVSSRDYPNSEGCYSYSFRIHSDGTYSLDPCTYSSDDLNRIQKVGQITQSELNELNRIATLIVLENLAPSLCCGDLHPLINTYSLIISVPEPLHNYEKRYLLDYIGEVGDCFRGPEANLDRLHKYLSAFVKKYIPTWGSN